MTASWYTKEEHALRVVIWGSANSGMDVITSLINYGIGSRAENHPGGLAAWKGISLFLGSLTIVISVFTFFLFGTPREVRWLSETEKRMAYARIVKSQTGSDAQKRDFDWQQVWDTFKDPQTYFFFFTVLINSIPNGGTTSFGNLVYVGFGFTALETIAEGKVPQQALSIICLLSAGYLAFKKPGLRRKCSQKVSLLGAINNIRLVYLAMISVLPAFAGMLSLALLPKEGLLWTRWGLYFITIVGNVAGPSKSLFWPNSRIILEH